MIGNVYKIGTTETIQTKSGGQLLKRRLVLIQKRFDQNTGQEFEPNYPSLEFTNTNCQKLDQFKPGDRVRVRFDVSGTKFIDNVTGEEKFFSSLRGFSIEPFVSQRPQPPQNYAPTGQYPPAGQAAPPPQGYYPPGVPPQNYQQDPPF
jgi:hypothetical protein